MKNIRFTFALLATVFSSVTCFCQQAATSVSIPQKAIHTAFPFLLINSDARTGAMGESGVAFLDDKNSLFSNPSKIAFSEARNVSAVSYSPIMKSLADGISLSSLSTVFRVNAKQSIGGTIRYLSLGTFELVNDDRQSVGAFNPREMAIDLSYAQTFGDQLAIALTGRFINSSLRSSGFLGDTNAGNASGFGVDISAIYKNEVTLVDRNLLFSVGMDISNIGPKISYSAQQKEFLPTNLKIGSSLCLPMAGADKFTLSLDLNKLLVPSPNYYGPDQQNRSYLDKSVPSAIFSSFSDADGGISEEISEISVATGIEFFFKNKFALRGGYFYESPSKGNRRYLTLGTGIVFSRLALDIGYIAANPDKTPMANALKFTLFLRI
ncbi:type IX secretion system outer membrane channel protein PorV [Pedobacter alluvionis]|uniref:Type IX secretion system outer membrane channel protein PorV n=1 Tax=Pedobacter alluvionis TaxID=475253 RepID=A0A497YCY2_9SPHI|nr:type IX secretion system outer membrane channel protein PorV [Pedobacter alluvionis]RLJ80327.1 hypothetical protein BCL90_1082 [Pedobacter alluvionis]TFB31597.1 type IX secretion system outer membrane channel protein PorV [Pedobacter alluvionis]